MQIEHKGHEITAEANMNPDTNEWTPWLSVLCPSESGNLDRLIKRPMFNKTFATKDLAEKQAVAFAIKWIDDGKPPLPKA